MQKIIFILVDTLRAQNIGIYGATPSPTPTIDQLAKRGVVFTHAYATITKTDPSILAIIAGKYPISAGLINHGRQIAEEEKDNVRQLILLPELLKSNGYKTAAVDWLSRWHARGYDIYSKKILKDEDLRRSKNVFPYIYEFLIKIDMVTAKLVKRSFPFLRIYFSLFQKAKLFYDPADVVVDKALEILKKNRKNKLFLYIHLWDPHWPHMRPNSFPSYIFNTIEDTYNAEISFLDREVGRLIDFLKETKQLDDTLIILTADHGENLTQRNRPFYHEGLYEEVVRVPLLLVHPSLKPQRISALVQHVDLLPTILDMVNIVKPKDIDGNSLLPLILREKKKIRELVYFEDISYRRIKKNTRKRGIRIGNYKYIETLIGKKADLSKVVPSDTIQVGSHELYFLKRDPLEKYNIAPREKVLTKKLNSRLHVLIRSLYEKRLSPDLKWKIEKSSQVIRKVFSQFEGKEVAVAWTGGKDSTMLLHLIKTTFAGKIPFRVLFNDSTMEFGEIYKFIDKVRRLWNIDLVTVKHAKEELREFSASKNLERKKELARLMKITAIQNALKEYRLKGFLVGIRWDEHEARSNETYFSKRKDHLRIHPILHFTEKDIWNYIRFFNVPYVKLYDKGYRSLGEKPFTAIAAKGGGERSGRDYDKEEAMGRLRRLGYW